MRGLPHVSVLPVLLALAIVLALAGPVQAGQLPPRDEADKDAALVAFRQSLRAAVARKDARSVSAAAAPDVVLSFDGDQGRSVFRDFLTGDDDYWDELSRAVNQGGVFQDDGSFCQPYWACVDLGDLDPFEAVVVIKDKVVVRAQPQDDAEAIATLGYEVLKATDLGEVWTEVELPQGRTGFVHTEDVGSPAGYRLSFEKRGGAWQIASFVAGD